MSSHAGPPRPESASPAHKTMTATASAAVMTAVAAPPQGIAARSARLRRSTGSAISGVPTTKAITSVSSQRGAGSAPGAAITCDQVKSPAKCASRTGTAPRGQQPERPRPGPGLIGSLA